MSPCHDCAPVMNDRRAARVFGLQAETLACGLLMAKGYSILARNYTVKGGEIDVIARRGRSIAFVEVKARPSFDRAAMAIQPQKIRRISLAARVWLGRNAWAAGYIWRGDAVFIAPVQVTKLASWRVFWPQHLIAAFELAM